MRLSKQRTRSYMPYTHDVPGLTHTHCADSTPPLCNVTCDMSMMLTWTPHHWAELHHQLGTAKNVKRGVRGVCGGAHATQPNRQCRWLKPGSCFGHQGRQGRRYIQLSILLHPVQYLYPPEKAAVQLVNCTGPKVQPEDSVSATLACSTPSWDYKGDGMHTLTAHRL